MFNTLGVAACASMFTKKPIQIDWWPITRDSIVFSINISILVIFAWDGVVMWYETIIMVILYVGYWFLMFQNPRIMKFVKHVVEDKLLWCQRIKNYDIANQRPFVFKPTSEANVENGKDKSNRESYKAYDNFGFDVTVEAAKPESVKAALPPSSTDLTLASDDDEDDFKIWEIPRSVGYFELFWYFFTWPIRFLLHYTIPNPKKYKKWFVFPFAMCIVWIAGVSYMIFWMVVIVGDVFNIPEAVMGLTFLAFGGCMPEAISAVIVARKGSGQMGVSNALGANSLAILFSLGVPWFIRTMASGAWTTGAKIRIFSHGIEYTIMALLLAVATLYITISAAGYKLRKTVGAILFIAYVLIATFAILVELDVFFEAPDRC
jgi:Ca2+/Na+ antiporter